MGNVTSGVLQLARYKAGVSQSALALKAGTSRTKLSAYENGHVSPTLETAERILNAVGFSLEIREELKWTKVSGPRGASYNVPTKLPRLSTKQAFAQFQAPVRLDWSRADRAVDLRNVHQRNLWYELVLREGTRADIVKYIDGVLLVVSWPNMVLPSALGSAWTAVIERSFVDE